MPVISVIVPAYNVEDYIEESLNSIRNQTLEDFEVICVDDGSIDSSVEIINKFVKEDSRFKLIKGGHFGIGNARNKALDAAMGEFVVFVDADDYLINDALSKIYHTFKEYPVDVVQFDYILKSDFFGNSRVKSIVKPFKKKYKYDLIKNPIFNWRSVKKACLKDITLYAWNKAYKKELIDANNIRFAPSSYSEDHIFTQKSVICASNIYYLNTPLYFLHLHLLFYLLFLVFLVVMPVALAMGRSDPAMVASWPRSSCMPAGSSAACC